MNRRSHESDWDMTRPPDPPARGDDGVRLNLIGKQVPDLTLQGTDGCHHSVDRPRAGYARLVLYAYPRTGRPGEEPLTPDWDRIPGARGCTSEACAFRDHAADLARLGAEVAGLSTQDPVYQQEAAQRLRLAFPLLSDADLSLTRALQLPTFDVACQTLLKRLTMIVRAGVIEHVFYPVPNPAGHAEEVAAWLQGRGMRR